MADLPAVADPFTMQRYMVEGVEFSSDFTSVIITFVDLPIHPGKVTDRVQRVIPIAEDADLRTQIWDVVDTLCDVLDEAYRMKPK